MLMYRCLGRYNLLPISLMTRRQKKTIAVAMSGGIDSSVSALLLKEQGYDVVGVFMKNWDFSDEKGESQCNATQDYKDMKEVCNFLKIESIHVDFSKEYWHKVFIPFIHSYQTGLETPNPDVYCNRYVKFHAFKQFIQEKLGIEDLATGHYARIAHSLSSLDLPPKLLTAVDPKKDQTYFLALTSGKSLSNIHFPIGHLKKEQVKSYAKEKFNDLSILSKKESMGICFIGKRDMKEFLSQYIDYTEGRFVDFDTGKVLESHSKQEYYTIGQGAKISGCSSRYFVIDKITEENQNGYLQKIPHVQIGDVLVGIGHNHPALFSSEVCLPLQSFNWISGTHPTHLTNSNGMKLQYKARHSAQRGECVAKIVSSPIQKESFVKLEFPIPHRALTPGQIMVLYNEDECLGGSPIPYSFHYTFR